MKYHFLLLAFSFWGQNVISAQAAPFTCKGQVFFVMGGQLYEVRMNNDSTVLIPFAINNDVEIDAIGYSQTDNFIYGIADHYAYKSMGRLGNDGKFEELRDSLFLDQFILVAAGDFESLSNFVIIPYRFDLSPEQSHEIYYFDLTSPNFPILQKQITTINNYYFAPRDIAIEPISEKVFSYNTTSNIRQINLIDLQNGNLFNTNFINNGANSISNIGALFWTSWGELGGMSTTSLSKIDPVSGAITSSIGLHPSYLSGSWDACSCPYTVSLRETVRPTQAYGCTEATYAFPVSSLTKKIQTGVVFMDTFAPGFEVKSIVRNPFGGSVSGLGSSTLRIENMTLPFGIDTLIVRVRTPQGVPGVFQNQAYLSGLDLSAGNDTRTSIASDNPATLAPEDPTPIEIVNIGSGYFADTIFLCPDSSVTLRPFPQTTGLEVLWSTGETSHSIQVDSPGDYTGTAYTGCDTLTAQIRVEASGLQLNLPNMLMGQYGDTAQIAFDLNGKPPFQYLWSSENGDTLCYGCPSFAQTLFSDAIIRLLVTDSVGCKASSSIQLRAKTDVYAPNAIKSKGDYLNTIFFLQTHRAMTVQDLSIFDRWGSLVFQKNNFQTNDPTQGWDAQIKQKPAPIGVYIWQATIVLGNGKTQHIAGNVAVTND